MVKIKEIHLRKAVLDRFWRDHFERMMADRPQAKGDAGADVKYSPDQPRDWRGRWTFSDGTDQTALLDGGGGGGGGGPDKGGSRRVCRKLDGVSIDGIICLYQCPDGSIRRFPNPFPTCTNIIFNYEGH